MDDPLSFAMNLLVNTRYNTKTYVVDLLNNEHNYVDAEMERIRSEVLRSRSSRQITYRELINIDLNTHEIYSKRHTVNEFHRIAFMRFRASAHSLAMEKWTLES